MSILLLVALSVGRVVASTDPITDETRVAYGVLNDAGDALFAGCPKEGGGQFDVWIIPRGYTESVQQGLFNRPSAVYRFDDRKPVEGGRLWSFGDGKIGYMGEGLGMVKQTARFVDDLARSSRLVFRWESPPYEQGTAVFDLSGSAEGLREAVARCAPKRLTTYLREWGSPAAP